MFDVCTTRIQVRSAAVIRCDEVGDNLDRVETVTVECYRCDPDNPLSVPRQNCPACRGTGRAPIQLAPIMREIREAKTQPHGSGPGQEDDLFLEY